MLEISSLLDKFKKYLTNETLVRERVAALVGEVLSVSIDPKDVVIKQRTASISGSSVLRSEIMLKRSAILQKLKGDPSTNQISEVR